MNGTQEPSNAPKLMASLDQETTANGEGLESQQDYIWSFALQRRAEVTGYQDPLVEMIRVLLDDFLNLGFLTCNGEPVRVTGFAFNNKPKEIYDVFLDQVTSSGDQHEKFSPLEGRAPLTDSIPPEDGIAIKN